MVRPAKVQPTTIEDDRLAELVDVLSDKIRRGQAVDLAAICRDSPEHAATLQEMLPTLQAMLELGQPSGDSEDAIRAMPAPERIGKFRIVRELGRGGMGVVYLAEQTQPERLVALKVLPPQRSHDPAHLERFQREIRAAAAVQHANVLPVLEVGLEPATTELEHDVYYFTMPIVDGPSLDRVIAAMRQVHPPPPRSVSRTGSSWLDWLRSTVAKTETRDQRDALTVTDPCRGPAQPDIDVHGFNLWDPNRWDHIAQLGIDVASVLSSAHGQEILHRDVKPSNLLLDPDGKVWVTDFGLAKFADSEQSLPTITDGLVGTLRFMAPERFSGWTDPRSDVYSLGATLYELATLMPAFESADRRKLMAAIAEAEPVLPRKHVPHMPADLETVILKAIDKDPADRYQTADQLRQDLQRFIDRRPIAARRTSWLTSARRWSTRNPVAARMGTAFVLFLLLATASSGLAAKRLNSLAGELEKEKDTATRSLLLAYEGEAQARTMSRRPGQRLQALEAIRNAVELFPQVEHDRGDILRLRNEAIAALTLTDVQLERAFPVDSPLVRPSPDFRYYAWSDRDARFRVCDANTGEQIWSFQFKVPGTVGYALPFFSPNSRFVAAYSDAIDRLRMFEVATGKIVLERDFQRLDVFSPVAFSANSRWFAIPNVDEPIDIYDLNDLTKEPQKVEVPFAVNQVVFVNTPSRSSGAPQRPGPAPQRLLDQRPKTGHLIGYRMYQDSGDVFVYDFDTGESDVIESGLNRINCVEPQGEGILIGYGWGAVRALDWPYTGRTRYEATAKNDLAFVRAHPAAFLFAMRPWGHSYQLRDGGTGRLVLEDWGGWPTFSNSGERFAVAASNQIRFYRIYSGSRCLQSAAIGTQQDFFSPDISASGDLLLATGGGENEIWDAESLTPLDSHTPQALGGGSKFLPDGRIVAITENKLTLFDVVEREGRRRLGEPKYIADAYDPGCIGVSKVNDRVAWRSPSRTIHLASLSKIEEVVEVQPKLTGGYYDALFALSPDGKYLAVSDETIRLFDPVEGTLLHDFGSESAGFIQSTFNFRPDGKQMLCCSGTEHMLFDLEQRQLVRKFAADGTRPGAAWSPDGSVLAMAIDYETLCLLNAETFEEIAQLRLPEKLGIRTVHFNPDGKAIFATVAERAIYRWELGEIREQLGELGLNWDD